MDTYSTSTENDEQASRLGGERNEELASQSGSDEGGSAHYAESLRTDAEFDDDSDALTTQTLNADGTPKRPMNAFMIFARRRRPQVSAENQAMRTGEISKILSKEWAIMPPSEKQYYLDRAKQLKETFNTKYPDYVYRRRPNNSRKKSKRRAESGIGGANDHSGTPEAGEDLGSVVGDYGDLRPDTEGHQYEGPPNVLHSRLSHDSTHPHFMVSPHSRSNPYPYVSSESIYRLNGSHDSRTSQNERISNDIHPTSHRLAPPDLYGYSLSGQGHSHPSHIYAADSGDGHEGWDSRAGPGRPGWITTHDRTLPSSGQRSSHYSTGTPSSWSGITSSSGPPPSSSTPPASFAFPTLTSPFYPNQAHLQSYQATASSSHPDSPARYGSPASHGQASSGGRDYEPHFEPAPLSSESSYQTDTTGDAILYQQRLTNMSRGLPPVQALASYAHSAHSSAGTGAPAGY
ncbi:hypothetical protein AMATHDRAFT_6056 [Amanita thiersii Skay4041]|uniref:HMG box domain-containing protein n=1 Tax=Amanita thiersii Skay4041 TaxID=703135 RepID=A0A2A9NKG6_9AGAR|nr:hypothetical protein AMATHDRAFT_6056 [Amanita thiersii Skay4041]